MYCKNTLLGFITSGRLHFIFRVFCYLFCLSGALSYAAQGEGIRFQVKQIIISGDLPISKDSSDQLLASAQNKEHTLSSLLEVAKDLEKELQNQGYDFYRVVLPQQPLGKAGEVTFKVVRFTVNQVTVEGNTGFTQQNILRALPGLKSGDTPNAKQLTRELQVAAYHPLKDLRLTFKRSPVPDTINAVVTVTDSEPENFALLLTNTGNDATGDYRLTLSYQNTNLQQKDHILNLSYTTSPGHFSDVQQYGVSYALPFYEQNAWLTAYAIRSDVDTGTVGALDISGAGTMLGVHYLWALPRYKVLEHWLDFGFDNKQFENDILFGDESLIPDVTSAPFSLTYKGRFPWRNNQISFYLQGAVNTDFGSDNADAAYSGNRENADRDWTAFRYGVTLQRMMDEWRFRGDLSGQYTEDVLISGEQFGLGGASSVRGYDEREIIRDTGYKFTLEAISPEYNGARFVGFFDYGYGFSRDVQPGDPEKRQRIASVGVGVRWQLEKRYFVRVDLAHALKDGATGETESADNQIHATFVVNF